MAGEDEIVVAIESDGALESVQIEPALEPADDLKAQFEQLQLEAKREKEGRESERAAREAAERQAQQERTNAHQARQEASNARREAVDGYLGNVLSGIDAAKAEAEAARREYRMAREAGDLDKEAEATDRLATARAKMVRLEEAKADIEAQRAVKQEPQTQQPPSQSDPVEAFISSRTSQTQQWLRSHRDYVADQRKFSKLQAAHHDATAEGLVPDSADYFSHIESFLGMRGATNGSGEAVSDRNNVQRQARSAPVAPVNGSGGTSSSSSSLRVTLSKVEAAAATDGTHVWGKHDLAAGRIKNAVDIGKPIGTREFARRKHEMIKDGHYDKLR